MPNLFLNVACVLALLAACAQPVAAPEANGPSDRADRSASDPVTIARQLVAERTGAATDELKLVSSEFIQFSDSGLGCPVEGRAYLQVITPGYRVVLMAGMQTFDVRVAGSRGRICERARI